MKTLYAFSFLLCFFGISTLRAQNYSSVTLGPNNVAGFSFDGHNLSFTIRINLVEIPPGAAIDQVYLDLTARNDDNRATFQADIRRMAGGVAVSYNEVQTSFFYQDYRLNITPLVRDVIANPGQGDALLLMINRYSRPDFPEPKQRPQLFGLHLTYTFVPPTITSSATSACEGGNVPLTISNFSSTQSYQWQKDGTAIPGATSQTYSATSSGLYTVSAGSSRVSNGIPVTIYPKSPVGFSGGLSVASVCNTKNIYVTAGRMSDYRWSVTGGTIIKGDNTNQIFVHWNKGGEQSVSVSYTDENNCPSNTGTMQVNVLDNDFCYQFDDHQRMVTKKTPDADWIDMVYDEYDRLVLTQDGNQRAKSPREWTFIKYDQYDRPILSGIYKDHANRDRQGMQTAVSDFYHPSTATAPALFETFVGPAAGNVHYYSNTSFPQAANEEDYLSATYYDDYAAIASLQNTAFNYVAKDIAGTVAMAGKAYSQQAKPFLQVKGLVTATKTKVLDANNVWLWGARYYDQKLRVVQTSASNHLGGVDRNTMVLDFTGLVLKSKTTHNVPQKKAIVLYRRHEYDHTSRLLHVWHQVNNSPEVLLSSLEYNEVGQVVTKKLHSEDRGVTFKQVIDYRYNAQGWMTRINHADLAAEAAGDPKDLFGMELGYNDDIGIPGFTSLYSGNISATRWSVNQGLGIQDASQGIDEPTERGYRFAYDAQSRLLSANHSRKAGTWENVEQFNEDNFQYDQNGNILSMNRGGESGTDQDVLKYAYQTNKLMNVTDDGIDNEGFVDGNTGGEDDYHYDANGNLTTDKNKGLTALNSIQYNYLDKPELISRSASEFVTYLYTASGEKLRQKVTTGGTAKTIDYVGPFVYENGVLQFILHDEGRVVPAGRGWEYQYDLKDYLGNVRATFTTKVNTITATATMETVNAAKEHSEFLYYDKAVVVNLPLYDHTYPETTPVAGKTYNAIRLNGTTNERKGLAKSLSVMPGDKVKMEVYAKYLDLARPNLRAVVDKLAGIATVAAARAGIGVDGGKMSLSSAQTWPADDLRAARSDASPDAFLNYVILTPDGNVTLASDRVRISENAREDGTDRPHEQLLMEIEVRSPGLLYTWISNENDTPVEVYFDDFTVEHTLSPLLSQADYYPFGLAFNDYHRENVSEIKYLYQGKELEENTQWYDFHARRFDPQLGRFTTMDPKLTGFSLFVGMGNNPVSTIDQNGEEPITIAAAIIIGAAVAAASYTASVAFSEDGFDNWNWGSFALNVGVGAVSGAFSFGVGSAVAESGIQSWAGQQLLSATLHAHIQGTLSVAQNGSYGSGALSGFAGSWVGAGVLKGTARSAQWVQVTASIGSAAAVSGVASEASGDDFWKGFAVGAIVASANHVAHGVASEVEKARFARIARVLAQQVWPTFETMWLKYPCNSVDNNGDPIIRHPSLDDWAANQCAVRMCVTLEAAGVD
ncbi:RHS repeat-associated core domain-containing protein [Chryseolinea serpens]|uniref:RHS repeat-associated core domain-containing protein n=1 Tax=Chryseolinea serpens TaxID=947013 RepID=A0A1M5JJN6_9BACT|nr:RHS repeat-associated core domain-containing protein [Chryseolinea serpens]SHG40728.1 RHS repeat-associated core domain-containing protein [Chryseolinea serpens]